jgi:PTH1 family peptidyl-tRNA hydrolase
LWAVVGLGNPGRKYARTRHNVGFMVVEALAERAGIELRQTLKYSVGRGSVGGVEVLLAEPLTFMNLSGSAVRDILKRYGVPPENLVVVHDDIDMDTGRLKIRAGGSSGGHKGVQSIIEHLGTRDFARVKVGVGRPEGLPVEEYVLRGFRPEDAPLVKAAMDAACEAVVSVITEGVGPAMNRFNRRPSAANSER